MAFTALYMAIAAVVAVYSANWEFVLYILVLLVLGSILLYIHRRVVLSDGALWALSIWGMLHMAGGLVPVPEGVAVDGAQRVLYSLWLIPDFLKYDQVIHAYGIGIASWVSWQVLRPLLRDALPRTGILALCVFCGLGLGALNEMVEFIATLIFSETNVGGYKNTGWDLVFNAIGALTGAAFIWRHRRTVNPNKAP